MSSTKATRALRLYVYRWSGPDCTRGGITSVHDNLELVGGWAHCTKTPFIPMPTSTPSCDLEKLEAPVLLVRHPTVPTHAYFAPAKWVEERDRWEPEDHGMAGGNYANGDSRVSELFSALTGQRLPGLLAVHDRFE